MTLVNDKKLKLQQDDDRSMSYEIDSMTVTLLELNGKAVVRRERFDLGPKSNIHFDKSEMPDWISLLVERAPSGIASTTNNQNPNDQSSEKAKPSQGEFKLVVPVDLHIRARPNAWRRALR